MITTAKKRSFSSFVILVIFMTVTIPLGAEEPESRSKVEGRQLEETTVLLPGDVPLVLLRIPPGKFVMGYNPGGEGSANWIERPMHDVSLSHPFLLGRFEVTQRQWQAVMGTTPWAGRWGVLEHPDSPAPYITWNGTQDFCSALNTHLASTLQGHMTVRLPTEAEWEYACRAGTRTAFYWGTKDQEKLGKNYAWIQEGGSAQVVGQKLPNPWGLYDMAGNVWEWCQDWYGKYSRLPVTNPTGPDSGTYRVLRGSSWFAEGWKCGRSSERYYYRAEYPGMTYGFRLAASLPNGESPVTFPPEGESSEIVHNRALAKEKELAGKTLSLPGDVELKLIRIPPGTFMMGTFSGGRPNETPPHEVTITREFYMGKYEVTQKQWLSVMKAWPGPVPSAANGDGVGDTYPMYYVTWSDARSFVVSLNAHLQSTGQTAVTVQLPSEAQWEYAYRAGTKERFYWGYDRHFTEITEYAWYGGNDYPYRCKPVGGKTPNPFGLYDMSGNVAEWCEDWYGPYPDVPVIDPVGPESGPGRVFRGGHWRTGASDCRATERGGWAYGRKPINPTDFQTDSIGFRVVAVTETR